MNHSRQLLDDGGFRTLHSIIVEHKGKQALLDRSLEHEIQHHHDAESDCSGANAAFPSRPALDGGSTGATTNMICAPRQNE
jgi:hypothetical protein